MTEKKAKKILDFLARKIKFDKLVIEYLDDREYYVIGCTKNEDSIGVDLIQVDSNGKWALMLTSSPSYIKVLENLLEMSRVGSKFICGSGEFLPANIFLEEILVEMDLEDGLK